MLPYKKILAVIDPTQEQQKSLNRAIEIADKTSASITAFLTIYDFSYEMTTMLSVEERESMRKAVIASRTEWLEQQLAAHPAADGKSIDLKVVWHNRPFESIIHEVISEHYDFVVKATHKHSVLQSVIFTPTDWHLVRKCPCPVLLVKEHDWPEQGKILAAVNQGTEDVQHQLLNDRIATVAKQFSDTLHSDLHLVNSYPSTPVNIAIEIPEFDPNDYNKSVKDYHRTTMKAFASEHQISIENTRIEEGLPEDVIPRLAKEYDAELVIIGTVGRTGFSAALIGNTAEHVIDSLDCDVLCVKPEGFKSPLEE